MQPIAGAVYCVVHCTALCAILILQNLTAALCSALLPNRTQRCTVLHCTALYRIVLYQIALPTGHCTVPCLLTAACPHRMCPSQCMQAKLSAAEDATAAAELEGAQQVERARAQRAQVGLDSNKHKSLLTA